MTTRKFSLIRTLSGVSNEEASRRLSIAQSKSKEIERLVTTLSKKEARKSLIELFDLDLCGLTIEEAVLRVPSFPSFFYPSEASSNPDLKNKRTLEVIDALGSTSVCDMFIREDSSPYQPRKAETAPRVVEFRSGEKITVDTQEDATSATVHTLAEELKTPVPEVQAPVQAPVPVQVQVPEVQTTKEPYKPTVALLEAEKAVYLEILKETDKNVLIAELNRYGDSLEYFYKDLEAHQPTLAFFNLLRRRAIRRM